MSWRTEIARPEIRALRAYEHAVWEPGLVRLNANELPWRSSVDHSQAGLNRYPEPHPWELTAALAQFYAVGADMLLAGRGSDEIIDLLVRSYCRAGQDAVMICPPTFGMYAVTAQIQGARVLQQPLRPEADFELDASALLAQCDATVKLVFLCSPNNPTGNRMRTAAVLQLAQALEGRSLLVVDEAYVEFSGAASLSEQMQRYPALAVMRTLSKAYGLAGARCGVLLAQPDVVALLRKVIQPYAVTQLTIEAVFQALQPEALAHTRRQAQQLTAQRTRMREALSVHPDVIKVWPSEANFLLVEFRDPQAALSRAHAAGLLIRDMRGALGLSRALRISIGTPEQNQRLLQGLQ